MRRKAPAMVNANRPQLWNPDTAASVSMYNDWFLSKAPQTFRQERDKCINDIGVFLKDTDFCRKVTVKILQKSPKYVTLLRMMCAPPIARDRLAGLGGIKSSVLKGIESGTSPKDAPSATYSAILTVFRKLKDECLMSWLGRKQLPTDNELAIFQAVIADRLTGSTSDPILRNAQERRQLEVIEKYLLNKGYSCITDPRIGFQDMPPGSFAFHKGIPMFINSTDDSKGYVNTTADVVIQRQKAKPGEFPLVVECKSAGDYTNTNKRRKEESDKVSKLQATYGPNVQMCLFLCGYFNAQYLGYEAANKIDWVWEHRIDDFKLFGV